MNTRMKITVVVVVLLLFGAVPLLMKKGDGVKSVEDKPVEKLFEGTEDKAAIKLFFVNKTKPGFSIEENEIYLTQSRVARVKQVLRLFFEGPKSELMEATFSKTASVNEVFLVEENLCVIDLNAKASFDHHGGTTAEYQSLYTLFKTITTNFNDIQRIQVLVEGKRVESLAGHLDLMNPLTKHYF